MNFQQSCLSLLSAGVTGVTTLLAKYFNFYHSKFKQVILNLSLLGPDDVEGDVPFLLAHTAPRRASMCGRMFSVTVCSIRTGKAYEEGSCSSTSPQLKEGKCPPALTAQWPLPLLAHPYLVAGAIAGVPVPLGSPGVPEATGGFCGFLLFVVFLQSRFWEPGV